MGLNAEDALEHIGAGAAKVLHLLMFNDGVGDCDGRCRQLLALGGGRQDHAPGQIGGLFGADTGQDQGGFWDAASAAVVHDIAERTDSLGRGLNRQSQ